MFFILCAILFGIIIYYKLLNPHKYWKSRNVKHVKPIFLLGNMYESIAQIISFPEYIVKLYNAFPNERFFGFYQFLLPVLLIRDPDLIKQLGIKDFESFTDHIAFTTDEIDPLWSRGLFASQGEHWRHMRPTLSPTFTSSKMKAMFTLVSDCAEQFITHFKSKNEDIITLDMKETFTRYTNDVIATCAFGIKCDSLRDENNEFFLKGKEATDFSGLKALRFFAYTLSPTLAKIFQIKIISAAVAPFFRKLTHDTIKHREENGIIRPDMIHLLMEARKGRLRQEDNAEDNNFAAVNETQDLKTVPLQKPKITDDDVVANVVIFLFAGFDTSSTLMSYITYELAVNKDIQDRLKAEVDATFKECKGKLTYEALHKMKYMDMVVSETLRKWPPTSATDRICNKRFTIKSNKPGEEPLVIEKGVDVTFPIFGLHRDPKYYPDPERFDPERFSDENKGKIITGTFIPFGIGPRNCIGSRFALMENKTIIFHILSHFEIVPVEKSVIPVKLSPKYFNLTVEGGMWLGLKKRSK